ncbi:ABC transporter ATP-binding protein [Segnochrobactraceae bacterium EtOH-i3]
MQLTAQDLHVALGRRAVLSGVSLALGSGELVGLIGPNGAGKTTLLRALAGLLAPDRGAVCLNGTPLPEIPAGTRARRIAFLAQSAPVHWGLPVAEMVALGRLPWRVPFAGPSARDAEAIARAMAAADVTAFAGRRADTLSGGERMRALIARALAVEAPLLLADEPVAALDPFHQLQIMELLAATARAGTGVAVVLHDLALAARYCDRLVLLAHGAVLAEGPPAEVLTDPLLAEAYRVAVLRGAHDGTPFLLPWQRLAAPDPMPMETRP